MIQHSLAAKTQASAQQDAARQTEQDVHHGGSEGRDHRDDVEQEHSHT